jgi:hypothetical protein
MLFNRCGWDLNYPANDILTDLSLTIIHIGLWWNKIVILTPSYFVLAGIFTKIRNPVARVCA